MELVRRETELKLHFVVLPPPSRFLGRPSPEKLLRVFYSPKLWVCQGGGAWEAFSAWAIRRDVTSRRREIRWFTLQGGVGGGLTVPT